MLNPLRYVERLLSWQQHFSPVYPMVIKRRLAKKKMEDSVMSVTWICDKYMYIVSINDNCQYFVVQRRQIDSPTNYCPSYRGYYPSVDFCHSHLLFDEIEDVGNLRMKYIKIINGFKIISIKEQCFI